MIAVMKQNERSRLDSDLLQTFLVVAEARNITRAADRLGRTQSAISVQIQKLEDALSAKLFRREARGMTLTEAGEALLPAARRALGEIERIGDLFAKPLLGRVRVGIPPLRLATLGWKSSFAAGSADGFRMRSSVENSTLPFMRPTLMIVSASCS
jgi:DNA-binding transcriptional LysR family regulator